MKRDTTDNIYNVQEIQLAMLNDLDQGHAVMINYEHEALGGDNIAPNISGADPALEQVLFHHEILGHTPL